MNNIEGPFRKGPANAQGASATHTRARTSHTGASAVDGIDASPLADAIEELAPLFSSRVQERRLSERFADVDPDTEESASERDALLHDLAPHAGQGAPGAPPSEALLELARRILLRPGRARQLVDRLGDDPSGQYVTLLAIADLIGQGAIGPDPSGRAEAQLREAAAELLAANRGAVLADMNTAAAARRLGAGADAFRHAYRDTVLGGGGLPQVLRALLDATPGDAGDDFLQVLQSTRAAIGLDVAAARPSTDPTRLHALVSDLYNLEVIATVIDRCRQLGDMLVQRFGIPAIRATALTADLVGLSGDRWTDTARLKRLAERFNAAGDPACQVQFIGATGRILRQLPPKVFDSAETRDALLDTVQVALDAAIEDEENAVDGKRARSTPTSPDDTARPPEARP